MIVNIRGTNGSGKTHIVRELLRKYPVENVLDERGKIVGHHLGKNVYVVGAYREETTCGGCDTIQELDGVKSQDRVCQYVEIVARLGFSVLFEGLIVSSVLERYYTLAGNLREGFSNKARWVWAFMDTPPDVCIAQVLKRNGGKPFKTENLLAKVRVMERSIEKLKKRGEEVIMIDHRDGVRQVEELLAREL